jgi:hypothetical protein
MLPVIVSTSAPANLVVPAGRSGQGRLPVPTVLKIRTLDELASREDAKVIEILDDPLGASCRHSIRRLGEHLYEIARDTDAMSDVLERVADRDPSRYSLRATSIDKSWNEIGEGQDRWWS